MGWFLKRVDKLEAVAAEASDQRVSAAADSKPSSNLADRSSNHTKTVLRLPQTGFPTNEVVGESSYLRSIKSAVNGRHGESRLWLTLEREPNNRFDANAVRVVLEGKTLGYVPRSDTADLQLLLRATEKAGVTVQAMGRVYFSGDIGSVSYDAGDIALAWPTTPYPDEAYAAVWPEGRKLKVSVDESGKPVIHKWISRAYCPGRAAAYLQLELSREDGRVGVSYDGVEFGTLSPSVSSKMGQIIKIASAEGRLTFALGQVVGNALVAEVKISVKPSEELTEAEIFALTAPVTATLPPPTVT